MPTSLRLGALLFAAVSADQKVSTVKTKRDKKPLNSLLEAAKGMLKNGETAEATEFAEETLDEIAGTVLPAILDESNAAQTGLFERWALFNDLVDSQLLEWNRDIADWKARLDAASATHIECRGLQADKCEGKRTCEMELWDRHQDWSDKEDALRTVHDTIRDDHFCPPDANGTLRSFRVGVAPHMTEYLRKKELVEAAEHHYDIYRPGCITAHDDLDAQSIICNTAQRSMESIACDHDSEIASTLQQFHSSYAALMNDWNAYVDNVKSDEDDRHQEYLTILTVQCLLNRVRELNGRPCDEEGQVDEELAFCNQHHNACEYERVEVPVPGPGGHPWTLRYETYDPDHRTPRDFLHHERGDQDHGRLCLLYPEPAPTPPNCPAGVTTGDVFPCLPVHIPKPCDAQWHATHMATPNPLPALPQAPFDERNPGCNEYPSCEPCQIEQEPVVVMVDGCTERGASQNRQAGTASDGRTASVRCCSHEGDECFTEALGETCQQLQEQTFAQAVEICAMNGRRLCSEAEVGSGLCCMSGCGFDSNHVWVAESSSVYGD